MLKVAFGNFQSSSRLRNWFRIPGASPITLYLVVFSFFAVGSFFRDSSLFWLPIFLGFVTAVLFRMSLSDLLVVALPFHFRVDSGFSATLSLAHLAGCTSSSTFERAQRENSRREKSNNSASRIVVSRPTIRFCVVRPQ